MVASIIITIMGAALLRVSKLQEKWRLKLAQALEAKHSSSGKFGHRAKVLAEKYAMFLIASTCFLYLVAAGLFSRSIWYFEANAWNKATGGDASENGSGPGSYDIRQSVWHVNCCNPDFNGGGGWGIFNALFGWQNSATYGSVIAYNLYWIVVISGFVLLRFKEKRGRWPFMKAKKAESVSLEKRAHDDSSSDNISEKHAARVGVQTGGDISPA